MNAAEFKTLRESLGITQKWLAQALKTQIKAVQKWEEHDATVIPPKAIEILKNLQHFVLSVQYNAFQQFLKNNTQPILLRYTDEKDLWSVRSDFASLKLPLSFHHMLTVHLYHFLHQQHRSPRIVFFNKAHYEEWLGGQKDDEASRLKWAISTISHQTD